MAMMAVENIARALIDVTSNMTLENYDYEYDDFDFASYCLTEAVNILPRNSADKDTVDALSKESSRLLDCADCIRYEEWIGRVNRLLHRSSPKYRTGGWMTISNFATAMMRETDKMVLENPDYDLEDYRFARLLLETIMYSVAVSCYTDDQFDVVSLESKRLSDCIDTLVKRRNKEREEAEKRLEWDGKEKMTLIAQVPSGVTSALRDVLLDEVEKFEHRLDAIMQEAKKSRT